jgi:hypothetical protein
MYDTLRAPGRIQYDDVIEAHAIGGAIAATLPAVGEIVAS